MFIMFSKLSLFSSRSAAPSTSNTHRRTSNIVHKTEHSPNHSCSSFSPAPTPSPSLFTSSSLTPSVIQLTSSHKKMSIKPQSLIVTPSADLNNSNSHNRDRHNIKSSSASRSRFGITSPRIFPFFFSSMDVSPGRRRNGFNTSPLPTCSSNNSMYVSNKPGCSKLFWPNGRIIYSVFIAAIFICTLTFISISKFSLLSASDGNSNSKDALPNNIEKKLSSIQLDGGSMMKTVDANNLTVQNLSNENNQIVNEAKYHRKIMEKTITQNDYNNINHSMVILTAESKKRYEPIITSEKKNGNKKMDLDPTDLTTFSSETCLNYFHLHKTGGVSFKERIYEYFFNKDRIKPNGELIKIFDTCHQEDNNNKQISELGKESIWSCDLIKLENMKREDINKIDIILGHQYWDKGRDYFTDKHDIRYFTILRHPLHRKISFYYHFFIRNIGIKNELSVTSSELKNFILDNATGTHNNNLLRDAGPAYYASRLWSDGWYGFQSNKFNISSIGFNNNINSHHINNFEDIQNKMISNSIEKLRKKFIFIGLQNQEKASLCMLQKTIGAFSKAKGISNVSGIENISKQKERLNTGSYLLDGRKLWDSMSEDERRQYKKLEKVDLGIYKEGVKMFNQMVERYGCQHLVEKPHDDNIALF